MTDPDTNEQVEYVVDLTTLKIKMIDESKLKGENKFEFELPNSKVEFISKS